MHLSSFRSHLPETISRHSLLLIGMLVAVPLLVIMLLPATIRTTEARVIPELCGMIIDMTNLEDSRGSTRGFSLSKGFLPADSNVPYVIRTTDKEIGNHGQTLCLKNADVRVLADDDKPFAVTWLDQDNPIVIQEALVNWDAEEEATEDNDEWGEQGDEVPAAEFSAQPQSGAAPLTVTLNNTSQGSISACTWSYGDGTQGASCELTHTHTYTATGTYSVTLTVTGPAGTDTITRSSYISVSPAPALTPTPAPAPLPAPERLSITAPAQCQVDTGRSMGVFNLEVSVAPETTLPVTFTTESGLEVVWSKPVPWYATYKCSNELGTFPITITAQNSAGSITETIMIEAVGSTDTELPVVNWVKPVGTGEWHNVITSTVQLEVNATDNVGVTRVRFDRWDAENEQWIHLQEVSEPPYQIELDPGVLNSGFNHIRAIAYDQAGNQSNEVFVLLHKLDMPPEIDRAELDKHSIHPQVLPEERVHLWIRVRNTGTTIWQPEDGYNYRGTDGWQGRAGALPGDVAPGETLTFEDEVTAPQQAGDYTYGFTLLNGNEAFSPVFSTTLTVATPIRNIEDSVNSARLESSSDPIVVTPGEPFDLRWTIRNEGTTTWSSADGYGLYGIGIWEGVQGVLWEEVPPGDMLGIWSSAVAITQTGVYTYGFALTHNGAVFSPAFLVSVTVRCDEASDPGCIPEDTSTSDARSNDSQPDAERACGEIVTVSRTASTGEREVAQALRPQRSGVLLLLKPTMNLAEGATYCINNPAYNQEDGSYHSAQGERITHSIAITQSGSPPVRQP